MEEIKQNGITKLSSEDEVSIPVIFNNLTKCNDLYDYTVYIQCVAIRDMGFDYGEIEYYRDGVLLKAGTIKRR